MAEETALSIKNLFISYSIRGTKTYAVRGVSLDVPSGEAMAVVGESGSGKTALCKAIMGLLGPSGKIDSGSIEFEGRDLAKETTEKGWGEIRGKKISIVMQDPMASLNPLMRVGEQVAEAAYAHLKVKRSQAMALAVKALAETGIDRPERRARQFPHEFSGGMRQRAAIAMAIASNPKILICDEPTTALDPTVQAQILDIIKRLIKTQNLTVIFITHDLGVVASVASSVAVMYAGDIIEIGSSGDIFERPAHPYTWALLSSMPQLSKKGESLYSIPGSPPDLSKPIMGDAFAPRNPYALNIDFKEKPPFFAISKTHKARSWLLDPRAPKTSPPESVSNLARGIK